jgi:hypothetical protein
MSEPLDLDPADEADLVALADGCLPPRRTAEVEARVAADAGVAAALGCQRRALALLAGDAPCPSAALLERLGAVAADRAACGRLTALVAALQQLAVPRQRR